MPRPNLILASALLCATALACGGDDKADPKASSAPSATTTTSSPTAAAMTKAEWVAAVNPICKRVEDDANEIDEPKTAADYEAATTKLVSIIETANADIAKLTPPADDASAIEENFTGPNRDQEAAFKAALPLIQQAAASNDLKAAEKAFGDAVNSVEDHDSWIEGYGLTDCV